MKRTFKIYVGYWTQVKKPHSYSHNHSTKEWKKENFIVSSYTLEAAKDEVLQFLNGQGIAFPRVTYWECFGITADQTTLH